MKKILDRTDFVFTPGAAGAGTIAFRGEAPAFEFVQLITNVTRGVVVYQFNSTTRGSNGYNEATNTLTLDADTSTHSANDVLQVVVNIPDDYDGQLVRIAGLTPQGYRMGLRVSPLGGLISADNESLVGTRSAIGTVLQFETTGYNSVVVQLFNGIGALSWTVTFQVSNDGTTWTAVSGWPVAGAAAPVSTATAAGQWVFPAAGRFFRVQCTAFTSGAPVAVCVLKNQNSWFPAVSLNVTPAANSAVNVGQVGGSALAAEDTAAPTVPMIVGGVVRTALPASTVVAGDAIRATFTPSGQTVTKAFAPGDLDFFANFTVTGNVQVQIRPSQGVSSRNNVTSITYQNTNATATVLTIQDGSSTLITFSCAANMADPVQLFFPTPLRGSVGTALNFTPQTAGANVLLNVTGFTSY